MPRSSTIDPSPCNGSFHGKHCFSPFRATAATITIVGTPLATGVAAMKIVSCYASGAWGDVHIPAEGSSEDRHHLTHEDLARGLGHGVDHPLIARGADSENKRRPLVSEIDLADLCCMCAHNSTQEAGM
jgi:hypothetical protein